MTWTYNKFYFVFKILANNINFAIIIYLLQVFLEKFILNYFQLAIVLRT